MKAKNKKPLTVVLSVTVCVGMTADIAEGTVYAEGYRDTDHAKVLVFPESILNRVSPYIFGINDIYDISGVNASVLKQTGTELSSYNWENNASNSSVDGTSSNGIQLFDINAEENWETPALYTDNLIVHAEENDIPVRLVTLQMMGFVANDAMGAVSEKGPSDRWAEALFDKNESYLNVPDKDDNKVYIDEYAAFLVNKYGTVEEGGINGFFLDTEPEKWSTNYPILELPTLDGAELIDKSASLSSSVKIIDENALIFGPSVDGVSACADLNGSFLSDSESFADYYLSGMKSAGEKQKRRLLDVFDIHYTAVSGSEVCGYSLSDDVFRIESVRALYDESYSDNTEVYNNYSGFFPVLKTLSDSIERSYPGTKLSFSEYNFGGGDNMSGCIAEADALGAFAENGVYLACLYPDKVNSYQKAALCLYNNYDYEGAGVGNIAVKSDDNDEMSFSYAFADETDKDALWVILANKNQNTEKSFDVVFNSAREYSLSEMYTVTGNSSEIVKSTEALTEVKNRKLQLNLPERSVCLLVLKTNDTIRENGSEDSVSVQPDETLTDKDINEENTSAENPEDKTINIPSETEEIGISDSFTETGHTLISDTELYFEPITNIHDPEGIGNTTKAEPASDNNDEREFPFALKAIAVLATAGCVCGIIYVFFVDK